MGGQSGLHGDGVRKEGREGRRREEEGETLIKTGSNSVNKRFPVALLMRVHCGLPAIVPAMPLYLNFIKRYKEEFAE